MSHGDGFSGEVLRRSPEATHPTLYADMGERVDYACVIASFVGGDEPMDADDLRRVRELCREIGIPPHLVDGVIGSVGEPPERLRERLFRLRESSLRLMLVRDMILLGYADGRYDLLERRKVRGLCALMLVGEDKVKAMEDEIGAELKVRVELPDEPAPEPVGAWAGVVRMYRRLMGTLVDDD